MTCASKVRHGFDVDLCETETPRKDQLDMQHHADFAVPITHWLWVESTVQSDNESDAIRGWAISLGWWTDPDNAGPSTGTLYLVVDERGGSPVWIAEGDLRRCQLYGAPR